MDRMFRCLCVAILGLCVAAATSVSTDAARMEVRGVEKRVVAQAQRVYEAQPAPSAPRKAAIFVNNNAGAAWNDKVPVLESQLSSRLGASDFVIISREDVEKAVRVFPVGPTRQQPAGDPNAKDQNLVADRNILGTRADRLLSDNTSALRLAQSLGADFLVIATINSLAKNESHFKDDQVEFLNVEWVLQTTYKVLDGVHGGAVAGDDFQSSRRIKVTPALRRNDGNLVNELLRDAAGKIAQSFVDKARDLQPPTVPGAVEIAIAAGVRDLEGNELTLPDIRVTENNEVVRGDRVLRVQASAAVEIDGLTVGTTPAKIRVAPGLHRLRVAREGCKDYEATITASEGLQLYVTLQLSEETFQRWKEIRAFLNGLDTRRKLTDAQVKVLEGQAQFLRQSRFSVSYDVKVDTKEGLKFNLYKSLY